MKKGEPEDEQLCIAVHPYIYINAVNLPLDILHIREKSYSTVLPYITVGTL